MAAKAAQTIDGIASGMDTAGIIKGLMEIEKKPLKRIEHKIAVENLKLKAYQTVNSMLLEFKNKVSKVADPDIWKTTKATSSNEKALSAVTNTYATKGSYTFRPARLASISQYMSKGFSDPKAKILTDSTDKSKFITLESSRAKVNSSIKLEDLNGGKGVFRGAIRITDASGNNATVDLSTAETIDDAIKIINTTSGVQVKARVKVDADGKSQGDSIEIIDESGGSNNLRIQNVGEGTTATDLGIAGSSKEINGKKIISGEQIYYLGNETSLAKIRDGLGVENGSISLAVKNGDRQEEITIDLTNARSIGDVVNIVNKQIQDRSKKVGGKNNDLFENIKLEINKEKRSLEFTGGKTGNVYSVTDVWEKDSVSRPEMGKQLGIVGIFDSFGDNGSFAGTSLLGDMNSVMLRNLSGAQGKGVGNLGSANRIPADNLTGRTLLKDLNNGNGVRVGSGDSIGMGFRVYEGNEVNAVSYDKIFPEDELRIITNNPNSTVDDLLNYLNDKLANSKVAGLKEVRFSVDSDKKGIKITGVPASNALEIAGPLAESLGLMYLKDGDVQNNWGKKIPISDISVAGDLYKYQDLTGTDLSMIAKNTALDNLYVNGTKITSDQLSEMFVKADQENALSITVAGKNIKIDTSSLGDGKKNLGDLVTLVNSEIKKQMEASGENLPIPELEIGWESKGLVWKNVDITSDFKVEGKMGELLGFNKNFTAYQGPKQTINAQQSLQPMQTGYMKPLDITSNDKLGNLNLGKGLSLDGDSLEIKFSKGDKQKNISVTKDEILEKLKNTYGRDDFTQASVDEYLNSLNSLLEDKIAADATLKQAGAKVKFALAGDGSINKGKGIVLSEVQSLGNSGDDNIIEITGKMTGSSSGILATEVNASNYSPNNISVIDIRKGEAVPVSVSDLGYVRFTVAGKEFKLNTADLKDTDSLDDMIASFNKQLKNLAGQESDSKIKTALEKISFTVNDIANGVAVVNDSDLAVNFIDDETSSLAKDLGVANKTVSSKAFLNAGNIERKYVDRATLLTQLNNGKGIEKGDIRITNAQGRSFKVNLAAAKTVGDVLDRINSTVQGVRATVNDTGDGIMLVQTNDQGAQAGTLSDSNIIVENDGGTKTATQLGIAGVGVGGDNNGSGDGLSRLNGKLEKKIEVTKDDTLSSIMIKIGVPGSGYVSSIINDGTGTNSSRLVVATDTSGNESDFILDTNIDAFNFKQTLKGQDALLLYGQPDSAAAPILLASSTNSNSNALLGITLDINSVSKEYVTINVNQDKQAVIDEIKAMVEAYNNFNGVVGYLDDIDPETNEPGALFGDSNLRALSEEVNSMFFEVYNPENKTYSQIREEGGNYKTWSYMDLGITFDVENSKTDSSGRFVSKLTLDLSKLDNMASTNWDIMQKMLSDKVNVANTSAGAGQKAFASFNFQYDQDSNGNVIVPDNQRDPAAAANGNTDSSIWNQTNGFQANKTIKEGENTYTINLQKTTKLSRIAVHHPNSTEMPASEFALKDFVIEYQNKKGDWIKVRDINKNSQGSNYINISDNVEANAVRITATDTNAKDGKFRLLDVEVFEDIGLANRTNKLFAGLTNNQDGFLATRKNEIDDNVKNFKDDMDSFNQRLEAKEESLTRKYVAMEKAMSQLQTQSSYLSNIINSLNNQGGGGKK